MLNEEKAKFKKRKKKRRKSNKNGKIEITGKRNKMKEIFIKNRQTLEADSGITNVIAR